MAAVDLGRSVRSKQALNYALAEQAAAMSAALGCQLHVGYAVPFSVVLRDPLDILGGMWPGADGAPFEYVFSRESLRNCAHPIDWRKWCTLTEPQGKVGC